MGFFAALVLCACVATPGALSWQQLPYGRVRGTAYNVSFDQRAFTINGERQLLHVGAIHYPRATPEMWPHLMQLSREAGINVIDTYMFWDIHEETEGVFDFETGRRNFIKFIEVAAEHGLFVQLRIGPYVCAEWTLGGIPAWLMAKEDIVFRTYDEQWMFYMERFTRIVVREVEAAGLMPSQGGPVIFLQIENEYGLVQAPYGEDGEKYVEWCAETAIDITDEVPWFMCQQPGAPLSMIETKNGYYGEDFLPGHFASGRNQPGAWTENWPGWFQAWGEPVPHRPTEDVAYAVARWFQYGGTLQTYYMWFGGTNFGRSVGGPFIITSYDYDVPLNEFGYPHPVKYRHLARLHAVLDSHAEAILQNPVPEVIDVAAGVEVSIYGPLGELGSVIFISNTAVEDTEVDFNGHRWQLPAWSVTIVDGADGSPIGTEHVTSEIEDAPLDRVQRTISIELEVEFIGETVGPNPANGEIFKSVSPLSQLPITMDKTDYMWYHTDVETVESQASLEIRRGQNLVYLFVNGNLVGFERPDNDNNTFFEFDVDASTGVVGLDILTMSMGLWNFGAFLQTTYDDRGLNGQVFFNGADITDNGWTQQPFLTGEVNEYFGDRDQVDWSPDYEGAVGAPFVWFDVDLTVTADIDVTDANHAYALDLSSLGKGAAWVNGHHIGRFWDIEAGTFGRCDEVCDYRGIYSNAGCRTGCGEPSQSLYHVPRSWLNADSSNRVVLFTETGGNPDGIELVQIDIPVLSTVDRVDLE